MKRQLFSLIEVVTILAMIMLVGAVVGGCCVHQKKKAIISEAFQGSPWAGDTIAINNYLEAHPASEVTWDEYKKQAEAYIANLKDKKTQVKEAVVIRKVKKEEQVIDQYQKNLAMAIIRPLPKAPPEKPEVVYNESYFPTDEQSFKMDTSVLKER